MNGNEAEPLHLRKRTGVITADPMASAAIGAKLQCHFMPYLPVIESGAGPINEWDHFGSALLAIGIKTAHSFKIEGSGVLIGPGLALAARHVFEDYFDRMKEGLVLPYAMSILPTGLLIWKLHEIVPGDDDVVILRLELCSDLPNGELHLAMLTKRIPEVGERVMIVGTRNHDTDIPDVFGNIDVRVGVGEVTDVYPEGRDKLMLPHPCFAVKCLTIGGMSGGPVFDGFGNLLGILTSSIEDDEGPSNASFWWPAAPRQIGTIWPPGVVALPTHLIALSEAGLVTIHDA